MIKIDVQKLERELQQNCDRIDAIADVCEKEQRERNEQEQREFENLTRKNQVIMMRMQAAQAASVTSDVNPDTQLRENMEAMRMTHLTLMRDKTMTATVKDTGIIPIHEQDMLKPLREGLIWNMLGIHVQSGLSGTLRWPKHGKAVAQWADEAAKLVDSKIDYSKLEMTGERLGIAIPVTREAIFDSQGVVESVINEEMPAAVVDVINAALLNPETTTKVKGPFADETVKANAVTFAGNEPTRKELLNMKAKVTASGIKLGAPCWVMTEAMKAQLEGVKVDAGSGRFLCENDKILGYPVFTSSAIGEGYIGFGDWSYQAAGFFGTTDLVVDPYTLAREHSTDFVLNMRFGSVTLYPEAFCLGKAKSKQ